MKRGSSPDVEEKKRQKFTEEDDLLKLAPREVNILQYAESHAREIQSLSEKLQHRPCGAQISQKLPKHMQRRAMGHNVKRLPRSVRSQFKNKPAEKKSKRPSRRHRRRPKNLLEAYSRRQRQHVWLETHIWHAKRFHMVDRWGHRLAWKPTQRGERAAYRTASKHCLIQDISYLCCIELKGDQATLLDGLKHLTSPETGQTFAAVSCLSGTREGQTVLYHHDAYPHAAIGPVSFMWNTSQPIRNENTTESMKCDVINVTKERQLWIWCHPACFEEVWTELVLCFNFTQTPMELYKFTPVAEYNKLKKKTGKNEMADETEQKKAAICDKFKADILAENKTSNVVMKSLSGSILRFRLTGPGSISVLQDTLQPAMVEHKINGPDTGPNDAKSEIANTKEASNELNTQSVNWWIEMYEDPDRRREFARQVGFMEAMGRCVSPGELPPHCVVALTSRDPRLTRPPQRTSVLTDDANISSDQTGVHGPAVDWSVSASPLWQEKVRHSVLATKHTDAQIHAFKAEQIVRGQPLNLGLQESAIPVIMVQRPGSHLAPGGGGHLHGNGGSQGPSWGSGVDLLLPRGWGMPFWQALVYRGARCGGLNELQSQAFEGREFLFPNSYPDTAAGRVTELELEKKQVNKYNRIPPAKRPNYTKLNVISPFKCPWDLLVSGKNSNASNLVNSVSGTGEKKSSHTCYILRSKKALRQLQKLLETNQKSANDNLALDIQVLTEKHTHSLVPVTLSMVHKGTPTQFAQICLPTSEDMAALEKDRNYGGPVEPQGEDPREQQRHQLKRELKAKGVKKPVKLDCSLTVLADGPGEIRDTGSREVVGYVSAGGFSLGAGVGAGQGFVTASTFTRLLDVPRGKQGPLLLVRNTTSLQYRFARCSVIV